MTKTINKKFSVDNYPYGFTLKTTCYFWVEFNKKRGFRICKQTINPKTNLLNNPKKSKYSQFIYMVKDNNNKISFKHISFYEIKKFNKAMTELNNIFSLFNKDQIEYLYLKAIGFLQMTIKSMAIYCNSKPKKTIPLIKPTIKILMSGYKTKKNLLDKIKIDHEALEATEEKNFQPYKVDKYDI